MPITAKPRPREAMAAITLMRTPAETALVAGVRGRQGQAARRRANRAREGVRRSSTQAACRTAGSRSSSTPTCAPLMREVGALRRSAPSATRRRPPSGRRRPRFAGVDALGIAFVNGHFVREAVGLRRACPKASRSCRWPKRSAASHPLARAAQPGACGARQSGLPAQRGLHGRRRDDPHRGGAVETPIHLRFVTAGGAAVATATRMLVVVEDGASVTLLESHEGPDGARTSPTTSSSSIAGDRRQRAVTSG